MIKLGNETIKFILSRKMLLQALKTLRFTGQD